MVTSFRSSKKMRLEALFGCLYYKSVCGMPLQTFLIKKAIRRLEVYFSVNKHIISYLCLMSSDGATWKLAF